MNPQRWIALRTTVLVLAVGIGSAAQAGPLIGNGGFEAGLAGWTTADQTGSDGSFLPQTGTLSPVNGFDVAAPSEGVAAAMSDAQGPGSHVLYQDFVVPVGLLSASVRFDVFVNNQADNFFSPDTLDFSSVNNQQARVDLMLASADPFSVAPSDVLLNLFRTLPGDPLVSGYTTVSADLTALLAGLGGQTLRLRFAEVDNQLFFNFGVDNVSLNATAVPEPATLFGALLGGTATLCVLIGRARHRESSGEPA
jgi:hypothetical protein